MNPLRELLALVALVVIALLFCYPQLSGKHLAQDDNIQWQCMAQEAINHHSTTGSDVLWSNSMYGGMPTFLTAVFGPNNNYPAYLQSAFKAVGKPAYFLLVYMLGAYVLLRVLKVKDVLALIGSIAYAFSTFNITIIAAGHETQALTLGYLPAALAGLYLIFNGKWLAGAALTSLSVALMAANGHYQVMYYALIMFTCLGIWAGIEAVRTHTVSKWLVAVSIAIGSGAVGLAPNLPTLLTNQEYAAYTNRGRNGGPAAKDQSKGVGMDKTAAFLWSSTIGESLTSFIPYLYGGGSFEPSTNAPLTAEIATNADQPVPLYWGPQPLLLGPVYFGAAVCFLFLLGLLIVPGTDKWWVLAASVIGFVLSWGKHLQSINFFLFDHVPLLNMFRAVTMAKVIPQLLMPFLAVRALQVVISGTIPPKQLLRYVWLSGGILASVCLVIAAASNTFLSFTGANDSNFQDILLDAIKQDRLSIARSSALKSAFFILSVCGLIWAFVKGKIPQRLFFGAVALVIVADLVPIASTYLGERHYKDADELKATFEPREIDKQILKDTDPYYRVLDLSKNPFMNATPAYYHKCIGGNSPALLSNYSDVIEAQFINGFNTEVLNMLNAKYYILNGAGGKLQLITNPDARGNAWFVDSIKWATTHQQIFDLMNATRLGKDSIIPNSFDSRKNAIVKTDFKGQLDGYRFGKDSLAVVKLAKYGLDDISYHSLNKQDGFAVFSDIYYPQGWKAYIDGKEATILNVNYILRGLKVPAGEHNIVFQFRPKSFYGTQPIALAGSIGVILLCVAALGWQAKTLLPSMRQGKDAAKY